MTLKKILCLILSILTLFSISACGNENNEELSKDIIGIALPTHSLQRWSQDGSNMKEQFEQKGYTVDLEYANDDTETQIQQLQNMIIRGCKVIIIGSIDGTKITDVIKEASNAGIKIISYDRLIRDSENIDFYATFDNYMVGTLQGQYLIDKLELDNGKGPFNLEIFAGSPDDNNATFFYNGAMDKLRPYIDSGVLKVKSGQIEFTNVTTQSWDTDIAASRMDKIVGLYGANEKIDAILSSNDSCAMGVIQSLTKAGYGSAEKPFPLLTGQDCDKLNVSEILKGHQSMSIFKDTRILAEKVVEMTESILKGEDVEVNDTETYDNGKKIIPSYLCEPTYADKSNYKEILIDSGYYTENDIK